MVTKFYLKLYLYYIFHHLKRYISNCLDDLAEVMAPDYMGNAFAKENESLKIIRQIYHKEKRKDKRF